jgi:SAM-dependent methyltransferase
VNQGSGNLASEEASYAQEAVARRVASWAAEKGAYTTIETYKNEWQCWTALSGGAEVSSAVEIGCGSGLFLLSAIALGYIKEGVGFDPAISDHGTDEREHCDTQNLVEQLGLSSCVRFELNSFESFLDTDEKYDLIIFRKALHHIYEASADAEVNERIKKRCIEDLRQARARLAPIGRLYLLESARRNRLHGLFYNAYRTVWQGVGPIDWEGERAISQWKEILAAAGFSNVQSARLPVSAALKLPEGRALGKALSPTFLISAEAH